MFLRSETICVLTHQEGWFDEHGHPIAPQRGAVDGPLSEDDNHGHPIAPQRGVADVPLSEDDKHGHPRHRSVGLPVDTPGTTAEDCQEERGVADGPLSEDDKHGRPRHHSRRKWVWLMVHSLRSGTVCVLPDQYGCCVQGSP